MVAVEQTLRKLQSDRQNQGGIAIITTYDGFRKHKDAFHRIEWMAVCLDEGQKLKNPFTQISQQCKALPSYHRIVLSGTPIQNSLRELWSIFDFIYPGRLGALSAFELEFATPIRAGGYTNISRLQVEIATQTALTLQRIVRPYILRRCKQDLVDVVQLPAKTEQILFCRLTKLQKQVYDQILGSSEMELVLARRTTAFRIISTLRKLCNHPKLVYRNGKILWNQVMINSAAIESADANVSRKRSYETIEAMEMEAEFDDDIDPLGDASMFPIEESGKLQVLNHILPIWFQEKQKVLLFSQTRTMLNCIEEMLRLSTMKYIRLDGNTTVQKRATLIDQFNRDESIFMMLLTTKTGGLGISLTAANRIIILDPDW